MKKKKPRQTVTPKLAREIRDEGRHRCGYCLTPEVLIGMPAEVGHIIPEASGGTSEEENLWSACRRCNGFKGPRTEALDPQTGLLTSLFNPRLQQWSEHFAWSEDGTEIIGKTPCGRATVVALKMNNPEIVTARKLWVSVGWWPPTD